MKLTLALRNDLGRDKLATIFFKGRDLNGQL